MSKLLSTLNRYFDHVLDAGAGFSGAIVVFIMLAVTCDITLRYTLNKPLEWVVEFSSFSLVAVTFFASAWLLRKEGHVSMDHLVRRQTPRAKAMFSIVTSTLCMLACLTIVWFGIGVTIDYYNAGDRYYTVLNTPKWPISAIVVFGYLLLFIQFIRRIAKGVAAFQGKVELAVRQRSEL